MAIQQALLAYRGAPVSGVEHTGITWAQSSVYSPTLTANATNMRDDSNSTGAATNAAATEWIRADLGSAKQVARVDLGGGFFIDGGWGDISRYLNGAKIQHAVATGGPWIDAATVSGMTDDANWRRSFNFPPVTARYWRLSMPGYLATSEFRLWS